MRNRAYRRRGSVYLLILGVAMLLTVVGVGSILAVRSQRQAAEAIGDAAEARLYAQSGIELGLLTIDAIPVWRTAKAEGYWVVDQTIGNGTFSLEVNDLGPSADLAASADGDPILLTATGFKGDARHKLQVRLASPTSSEPLTCLQVVMQAGGDMSFDGATVMSTQKISTNGNVTANAAAIQPMVEAAGTYSGGTYFGGTAEGVDLRTMPDANAFESYKAAGTAIAFDLISSVINGVRTIAEEYVGPDDAPGDSAATNANGVYIIDCGGETIQIRNSRIVGTLVLLNTGPGSSIYYSVNWEPALSGYPALLVDGPMDLLYTDTDLAEGSVGADLNGDTDTLDTFPSLIRGLVYISGDSGTNTAPVAVSYSEQVTVTIEGVFVVGGTYSQGAGGGDLNLTYQPSYLADPPPGFGAPSGTMEIVAGSWAQVVD